jgi:hypothetical protein
LVFVCGDAAELETSLARCVGWSEAVADEVGSAGVEMKADLGFHVFFETAAVRR